MATVDKSIADKVIANDGWYDQEDKDMGAPRTVQITEYDNAWGGVGYGLTVEGQRNVYTPSEYVINPRPYWSADKP